MHFNTQKKHVIDFLFPVALFFVFTVSALTVILLASNIYRSTTEHSSLNYTAATSLSYITEKIHQNNHGGIYPSTFDSCDALVIESTYNDSDYLTYIYEYEGELKELFIRKGVPAKAADGTAILPIESFSVKELAPHTLTVCCVDTKGQHVCATVCLQGKQRSTL